MFYFGPISSMTLFWIVAIILLIVAEFMTTALTTVWFVGGAIVAAIAAALYAPVAVQIVLFIVISLGLLLAIRPIAVKYFNPERIRTNVDAMLGTRGIVTERIDNDAGTGVVKVNGVEWTARSAVPQTVIEAEKHVVVQAVDGVKLIVFEDTSVPVQNEEPRNAYAQDTAQAAT